MRSFGTSSSWVSFNGSSYEVHARVGAVRVDVVASGVFAHGGYGALENIRGR